METTTAMRPKTRPIYKEYELKNGHITIRELTEGWQPLVNYYELTDKQQQEAQDRYDIYAEEILYIIAEETLYTLSDFMRYTYESPVYLQEFEGIASDTNTSSILIKINETGEAARLFIIY